MRKFYLLGSTNVFRSLVLMAIAAGSYQSLNAQTCSNAPSAGPCTGGNITENFNTNGGTFTSANFTYNAGGGNYQVNPAARNNSYTITSGTYVLSATGGNVGFSLAGSTSAITSVTIRILDASTNAILFTCTQTSANFVAANQLCVQFSGLTAGTAVKFQFVINTANGVSGDGVVVFDNFSNGGAAAALPVKLDNFEAAKDVSGIRVTWKASEEAGVARYEIQRSSDGSHFQTIGIISAESKKTYSYLDVLPSSANNFYRLKIVDLDNTARISHIVSIKSKVSAGIEAYPNPVRDRMIVQHPKAVTGTRIQVINLTGQVLRDLQVPANAVVTPVDITGLSNGTYYIVFRSGSDSFSQRITKQ
jgi:hypothetical protein